MFFPCAIFRTNKTNTCIGPEVCGNEFLNILFTTMDLRYDRSVCLLLLLVLLGSVEQSVHKKECTSQRDNCVELHLRH